MRNGVYKYAKLHGKIVERFRTIKAFAPIVGISVNSLSSKLWGDFPWKVEEITKCCKALDISLDEMTTYFFI